MPCKTAESMPEMTARVELHFHLLPSVDDGPADLADSLAEWAGERGYRWNERDGVAVARAMECWQRFRDTVPALRALLSPPRDSRTTRTRPSWSA